MLNWTSRNVIRMGLPELVENDAFPSKVNTMRQREMHENSDFQVLNIMGLMITGLHIPILRVVEKNF